jgi:hypothetical protein
MSPRRYVAESRRTGAIAPPVSQRRGQRHASGGGMHADSSFRMRTPAGGGGTGAGIGMGVRTQVLPMEDDGWFERCPSAPWWGP